MIGSGTTVRWLALATALAVLGAACSGAPAPTTSGGPEFPPLAVDAWLDALVAEDYPSAGRAVESVGASLVLAVENGLSDEQLAELLESGWSDELVAGFWASFGEEFGGFSGVEIDEIEVGRHRPLATTTGSFAVVVIDVGGTDGRVITQRIEDGTWKVDLLATLGGAFVPLVFDRVVDLGDGAAAGLIRARLVDTVLPSLDAAVAAYPGDPRLETEVIRIRRALGEP